MISCTFAGHREVYGRNIQSSIEIAVESILKKTAPLYSIPAIWANLIKCALPLSERQNGGTQNLI